MKNSLYDKLKPWDKKQYDSYEEHQENCDFMELIVNSENKPELKCNCKEMFNTPYCTYHSFYNCRFKKEELKKRKGYPDKYIQFGKYKYMAYTDIPKSYIAWLLKQDNLNKEIKDILFNYIIRNYKEDIINNFINTYYQKHKYLYSNSYPKQNNKNYNSDFDYGGDLFDAMQGCVPNGF